MSLGTPLIIARHASKCVAMPRGLTVDKKGTEDPPRHLKCTSSFSHNTIDGKLAYNILNKWPRDNNSAAPFLLYTLTIVLSGYPTLLLLVCLDIFRRVHSTLMRLPFSCSTYVMCLVHAPRPPLWSSGQSSCLQDGDVLCFLWGTNWIYMCYVEESRPPLWPSGQSSWLQNGDVLCFLWGTNWIYMCYVGESRPPLWPSGQSSWLQNGDVLCFLWSTNWIYMCYVEESRPLLWPSGQSSWLQITTRFSDK
jgi:hypothetical protein